METNKNIRPPIVTVMGHVDHGKTTLLDVIRKTNIVAREHGGITQHIGAYQVNFQNKPITFIDTPGHAAFEAMRSRGAEVADIVILTVAANDGVKPQTVEAIKHIKKADKPIIVAITKIDLPDVNIEKVKKELQAHDVVIESYGGSVPVVEVCAPKSQGVNELLEVVELVWQIEPQISNTTGPLETIVIESYLDKNKGPIVHAIVKQGKMHVGQKIQFDSDVITVRALTDEYNQNINEALPSKPIEILGFKKVIDVGTLITQITRTKSDDSRNLKTMEEIIQKSQEAKEKFKIVLKTDVLGSLEAICANLPEKIQIVASGVGDVQPADINLAKVTSAPIMAFNVKISSSTKTQADREKVIIREYKVIYELIGDLKDISESFEAAKFEQKIKGSAKIIAEFQIDGMRIAGSQVTRGKIQVGDDVIVKSTNEIKETKVATIKKFKKDVQTVTTGQECGIAFQANIDFKIGDIIESLG